LNELIGKTLKFKLELKKAAYIPEKYSYKTVCRYSWMDSESHFETKSVEKQKEPEFGYN